MPASSARVPVRGSQPDVEASGVAGTSVRGPACVISPVRIERGQQLERRLFQVGELLGCDGGPLDGFERGHFARVHAVNEGELIVLRDENALAFCREEEIDELVSGLRVRSAFDQDRKSTRLNSSHVRISYAVFCLKKKKTTTSLA